MARENKFLWLIVLGAIILGIFLVGSWFIRSRNALVAMDEQVESAWSEVDNQLQRRSDLIPNLVNTVRGFAEQEEEIFTRLADARARLAGAEGVEQTAESYGELQSALSRLLVVVENYPQLRSNENFIRLQDELAGTENRIAVARQRYNESVQQFNTRVRSFPTSIIADAARLETKEYFEVPEGAREVPEVDFGE
ncbi:MAG: LemA family protein [Alkalispirochaetaceae bacterium]